MAKTVTQVIEMARASINDPLARRFNATDGLKVYNRTLSRLFTERPDLFVGALTTAPVDKALADPVPYDDEFAQLHADMMVAEFEVVSDEEANAARAESFDRRARR